MKKIEMESKMSIMDRESIDSITKEDMDNIRVDMTINSGAIPLEQANKIFDLVQYYIDYEKPHIEHIKEEYETFKNRSCMTCADKTDGIGKCSIYDFLKESDEDFESSKFSCSLYCQKS
ncbi:MAG: hypothetical protein WC656_01515 [Sulfurimonas sp.]|jgi:hypothetical protein